MKSLQEYVVQQFGIGNLSQKHGLIVVKPGEDDHTQEIIETYEDNGWSMAKTCRKLLTKHEAKNLYAVHKEEDWYEALVDYMSSGPVTAVLITKPGDPSEKDFEEIADIKEGIRKKYAESNMRNVLHSSDSEQAFREEAQFFFNLVSM